MSISINDAEKLVKDSLLHGYNELLKTKEDTKALEGEQIDVTTKADLIVGKSLINFFERKNLIKYIYSEEYGKREVNLSSLYSVLFDDIDGSLNFLEGRNMLPHGTILGIFKNPEPVFNECLASGFLEFNSGNLFYVVKDRGTFLVEGFGNGQKLEEKIQTSGRKSITGKTPFRIIPDSYMLGSLSPFFARYADRAWPGDFRSAALHLGLIAGNIADVFITGDNCYNPKKRNTGEEIGPGYLLIKEAGGAVLDWYGNDIGNQVVGFDKKKTFNYIAVATKELGIEFTKEMNEIPEIVVYLNKKVI